MRRSVPLALCLCLFALSSVSSPAAASPPVALGFHDPVILPGSNSGSEPSIFVAKQVRVGARFASWQGPGEVSISLDGVNFGPSVQPDSGGGGDVTNAIDASGAFYLGQFCGTPFDLHACVQRSVNGGSSWPQNTALPADMHPGAADRPWIAIYPTVSSTVPWNPDVTRVYLEYHTFSPEELAYVTVSTDGGKTFSAPKLISADTNALNGSACNTIPGGVAVNNSDGTVYALWLSGDDVAQNVTTGCNYSQVGPFNKAWVSTSTDGGNSWTSHLAWQGVLDLPTNVGENAAKIFAAMAIDLAGQVHVILPVRRNDDPRGFLLDCETGVGACVETPQDTDLLMVTSPDKGGHWTAPVSIESNSGSYFFPWGSGGSAGIVDVIFYKSPSRTPNKPDSLWYTGVVQVTGAVATVSGTSATYTTPPQAQEVLLSASAVHGNGTTGGGICTYGTFCAAVAGSNRGLADSLALDIDPAGGANAIWTDNAAGGNTIRVSCQNSGPSAIAGAPALNGCYGPADVAVAVSAPASTPPGANLTYHVTVTNNGTTAMPATTSGVTLGLTVPSGAALVSATPSAGTCTGSASVSCALGILPTGGSITVDLTVAVLPTTRGVLGSTATVSAATTDPVSSNNTATGSSQVVIGPPATSFYTVSPCRFYDSRTAGSGLPLASGQTALISAINACGVPPSALALSLNVTVVSPTGAGNLVMFPGDVAVPATNTVNFSSGQTRANNAVMGLSGAGELGVFPTVAASGTLHVVMDVNGYFQ